MMHLRQDEILLPWGNARLRPKSHSRLMRVLGWLLRMLGNREFMTRYWTTLGRTIYYPDATVKEPLRHIGVIKHELVHVKQWDRWHIWYAVSYLLLPVPFLFAYGRWYWERRAYLAQLKDEQDVDWIVDALWHGYAWPWPRKWMRRWFERKLGR